MSFGKMHSQTDGKGHSSAVASVLYSRGGSHPAETTKSGSYVFSGDASTYHEWQFRIRLRVKAAGDEPRFYAEAMSKVVDRLRGEAFIVAKEIGLDKIWDPGSWTEDERVTPGVDVLIEGGQNQRVPADDV